MKVWGDLEVGELGELGEGGKDGKGGEDGKHGRDWIRGILHVHRRLLGILRPMRALGPLALCPCARSLTADPLTLRTGRGVSIAAGQTFPAAMNWNSYQVVLASPGETNGQR